MGEMLEYWHTVMADAAFGKFVFIRVTPDPLPIPSLSKATSASIKGRCWDIRTNEAAVVHRDTLHEIQTMLGRGPLQLHIVCGDFRAPQMDPSLPCALCKSIMDYLGIGSIHCLYYLILHEEEPSRIAQRKMLGALEAQINSGASICAYLLSRKADDGSRLDKFKLWRALMCEILVCARGDHALEKGRLYSLGYTSLNANDGELRSLRRARVGQALLNLSEQPIDNRLAWELLTNDHTPPLSYDPHTMLDAVRRWLDKIASQSLGKLSQETMTNLRILSGLQRPEDISRVLKTIKDFYKYNQQSVIQGNAAAAIMQYLQSVCPRLAAMPNVAQFPQSFLGIFISCLETISKERPAPALPFYPRKRLLQPAGDYLNECCMAADNAARADSAAAIVSSLSAGLIAPYKKILVFVQNISTMRELKKALEKRLPDAGEIAGLENKYQKYSQALQNAVNGKSSYLFGEEWLKNAGALYSGSGKVIPASIDNLLASGEELLRSSLSEGFNTTFITALSNECDTENTMNSFLDRYLINNRRMFFYIFDTGALQDSRHFIDDNLRDTPWAQGHKDNSVIINNDNIERLDLFKLSLGLSDYLNPDRNTTDNRYFGDFTSPGEQSGSGLSSNSWDFEADSAAEEADFAELKPDDTAPQPSTAVPGNERHIALLELDGRYLLSWDWEAGLDPLIVSVNEARQITYAKDYGREHALDVTQFVRAGDNDIRIYLKTNAPYGACHLPGKKREVKYCFIQKPKGLSLKLRGVRPGDMLCVCHAGAGGKRTYYPISVTADEETIILEGLNLPGGGNSVQNAPTDRFPTLKPVQDATI